MIKTQSLTGRKIKTCHFDSVYRGVNLKREAVTQKAKKGQVSLRRGQSHIKLLGGWLQNLCLNTTARGCELKGLHWTDVDLFARSLTIRTSKTVAGERVVPLTDVAVSALARLRRRAEAFGPVDPSHFIFAAFVPKFTFSGKKVVSYAVIQFDPTSHIKSWRTAWRTLTAKSGLPGFRFHDLRHCAITMLAESGASDSTIMAIAGHVSNRMLERYSHPRMEAKRDALEALSACTKMAGYDTNHDTNVVPVGARPI